MTHSANITLPDTKIALERDVLLGPLTTFGIGGPADFFATARSADELVEALEWAARTGTPWFVLGLGANVLIGDRGFRGLAIRNAAAHYSFNGTTVTAESGISIGELITLTVDHELSGLEHFINIPSTLGGAMWQNLHFLSPDRTRTLFIEEIVRAATVATDTGVRSVPREYFEFGYDVSILHARPDVVLDVTLELMPARRETMRETIDRNIAWRAEKHPPGAEHMSAGSIFRKIEGIGAGRLIEETGLKGARRGGAEVSHRHANYILNVDGATAADVRALIDHVQHVVRERSGFELVPEIRFIGEC